MLWETIQIHAKQENCEINQVKMKLIFYCSGYLSTEQAATPLTNAMCKAKNDSNDLVTFLIM